MKKEKILLTITIILSLVVTARIYSFAGEPLIKNFKVKGELDLRCLSLNNFTDRLNTNETTGINDDLTEQLLSRITVDFSGALNETISGKVTLVKNDRLYGTAVQNIAGILGLVNAVNAYIDVKKDTLNIRLGSQPLGEENDLVMYFGKRNDTALNYTSADAVNIDFKVSKLNCNVLYSKLNENAGFYTDTDLAGISIQSSEVIPLTDARLYLLTRTVQNPVALFTDGMGVTGLKATVKPYNSITCNIEAAFNLGANSVGKYTGRAFAFNAKYDSSTKMGKLNAGLDLGFGSGDSDATITNNEGFVAVASDKRYGEVIGRNLAGISNMNLLGLNASLVPAKIAGGNLEIGISYFIFNISRLPSTVALTTRNLLGNEIDLKLNYEITEKAFFSMSYGLLIIPDDAYYKALDNATDNIAQILATLNLKI